MKRKVQFALFFLILSVSISSCFNTENGNIRVYFSPDIKNHLMTELKNAKESIDIAIYVFTDRDIAELLNKKAKEKVKIRVLFGETSDEFSSSVDEILSSGMEKKKDGIHRFQSDGIMHDKFAIIDNKTLITGSYNWTYSANAKNNENLIIIKNNEGMVKSYKREFSRLWKRGKVMKIYIAKGEVKFNSINDVKRYTGKYVNGIGTVKKVGYSKRSGTYFLNFGEQRGGFTIVIFKRTASAFMNNKGSVFNLKGKTVKCYGKIKYYKKYGYEIILNDYKKLEIVND
ncbi:MAG: DUF1669 domain-containing protein [Proteobacteria bacterium]|nr:DUF1669 domain-containing protein [Pseudomonadota bacterium]